MWPSPKARHPFPFQSTAKANHSEEILVVTNFSTKGGTVTRSETYIKLLHHLDESRDCCAVIAHLHQTEDTDKDRVLSMGWLAIAELLKRMREQTTELAMGKLIS